MNVEQIVRKTLQQCINNRVNDLFLVKRDKYFQVYTKTVNQTQHLPNLSLQEGTAWLNYLKYCGQMNLSESRPQLGSLIFNDTNGNNVYLRLSVVGDFRNRESLVIRFIYPLLSHLQVIYEQQLQLLQSLLAQSGLIVLSGPVNAGKTTTLYYLAQQIVNNKTILTIEDPVEIINDDFIQLQVNEHAQMTYYELLKLSLRHHPDVLIIGEIRDEQTANAALRAALAGSTVLITVHARCAWGVMQRLLDFKVDRIHLQNCLRAISYQQLLPVNDQYQILFDIITGSELLTRQSQLHHNNWLNLLRQAYEDGQINKEVYQETSASCPTSIFF